MQRCPAATLAGRGRAEPGIRRQILPGLLEAGGSTPLVLRRAGCVPDWTGDVIALSSRSKMFLEVSAKIPAHVVARNSKVHGASSSAARSMSRCRLARACQHDQGYPWCSRTRSLPSFRKSRSRRSGGSVRRIPFSCRCGGGRTMAIPHPRVCSNARYPARRGRCRVPDAGPADSAVPLRADLLSTRVLGRDCCGRQ